MSSPAPGSDISAATAALEGTKKTLDGVRTELTRLKRSRKTDRIIGVVLVLLILGLGLNSVRVSRADAVAQSGHDSSVASCRASNVTRAKEIALWEHIYDLADVSKAPPKQQKADNELIAYIKHTFAPRDCQMLYRLDR